MKKIILFSLFAFSLFISPHGSAQDYKVGEGDILKINVYDHSDLATLARVTGDGMITFPLIGQIEVAGLSISQICDKIQSMLGDGYLINPQVTLFIEEFRSKKVSVLGQVYQPGLYKLQGHTSLLELISKSGGLTTKAGKNATITRKTDTPESPLKTITVNIKELVENGDTSRNVPIMDGDSIYISKAEVIYVNGQVRNPSKYKYEDNSTVIKAITMAGGLTGLASPTNIKIIRDIDGKKEIIKKVTMDAPLLPNDIVVVPESFF